LDISLPIFLLSVVFVFRCGAAIEPLRSGSPSGAPQKLLKDLAPCGFVVALTVLWSDQKWFKQMALFDDEHALTIRAPKKLARPC
jgi:hypothetical protein